MADDIAMTAALVAAVYEAVAVWTRKVPTITAVVLRFPRLVRVAIIALPVAWAVGHFEVVS